MGLDYHNHHVFCGRTPDKARVVADVNAALVRLGYTSALDAQPERSLAFASTGSWIAIFDSSDNEGEPPDLQPFRDLGVALSAAYPVVSVEVSDSAIVELTLSSGGRVIDRFANGRMPFFRFTSDADAAPFRGAPDSWCSVLGLSSKGELATAFEQSLTVSNILARVSTALGWNHDLATCGYFVSYDGDPAPYEEHLAPRVHEVEFEKRHYLRARTPVELRG
jgi:hypothetical protein